MTWFALALDKHTCAYAAIAAFDWQVQIYPGPNKHGMKTLLLLDCRVQKKQTLWVSFCWLGNHHSLLVQFLFGVLKPSLFFSHANRWMIPEQWTLWMPAVPELGTVKNLRHHHQNWSSMCRRAWSILFNIKPDLRQSKKIVWKNMVLQRRNSWNLVMIPFC